MWSIPMPVELTYLSGADVLGRSCVAPLGVIAHLLGAIYGFQCAAYDAAAPEAPVTMKRSVAAKMESLSTIATRSLVARLRHRHRRGRPDVRQRPVSVI